MKWAFGIQPKMKIALFLAIICIIILANIFWERRNLTHLNNSFSSIYEDRLLPATYVFKLTDHLYQKRLILEAYFHDESKLNIAEDLHRIGLHNVAMDTLIQDFEATYLVEVEDEVLHHFKRALQTYNESEACFIKSCKDGITFQLDETAMKALFAATIQELTALSQIQVDVSKAMREDSRRRTASNHIFTNLEALIVFAMAVIIQILIFTSRSVMPRKPQQHEWN